MARRRVLQVILFSLAVLAIYILQLGCEGIEVPEPDKNKWPNTELTGAPVESTATFYRVHLFWKGFDEDGLIQGFEYAIDDTSRNNIWTYTTRTDSEFVFNTATDESQQQIREHSFYVRAIDNLGKEDPSPSVLYFFAQTEAQPRTILLKDIARRVWAEGDYAYVAAGENGLNVYDITDPANAQQVSSVFTGGEATDIEVVDGYAYLGDGTVGLSILDVIDPANAQLIGQYPTLGRGAAGMDEEDGYLFLADGGNGVVVLDLTVPADPTYFAKYKPATANYWFYDVAASDNGLVFAAVGDDGILPLEFRPGESEQILRPWCGRVILLYDNPKAEALHLDVDGDILTAAVGVAGLFFYEIGADSVELIAKLDLDGEARQISRKNDHLLVANGSGGLCVVDASDPSDPRLVGKADFSGDVTGVSFVGDTIVVGNDDRGIVLLDGTDPAHLSIIGDSIVVLCPESPAEKETLLAYESVTFCWNGLSPGGQVTAYKYQLQGIDFEPMVVTPEITTVAYQTLEPKDEYIFTVEVLDETGLWSTGEGTAERHFTVNFDPETNLEYLEVVQIGSQVVEPYQIPLTADDTLLPDSVYIHFGWTHTDKDSVKGDRVVGSWWVVRGANVSSADTLETMLVTDDVAGPLIHTNSPVTLEVGGIDSFGRKEVHGATFSFLVNFPPTLEILSPEFNETISGDTVHARIQGVDSDGPPTQIFYILEVKKVEDGSRVGYEEAYGFNGTPEGIVDVDVAVPGVERGKRYRLEVKPRDRGGLGRLGDIVSVEFVIR
ncbi:MAG: hypothetical protein JW958_03450 [Candidatus Eisenbacteria bacterium]|nr:hypothetical protein [Candidatus Eisenbacteria bacterium]